MRVAPLFIVGEAGDLGFAERAKGRELVVPACRIQFLGHLRVGHFVAHVTYVLDAEAGPKEE